MRGGFKLGMLVGALGVGGALAAQGSVPSMLAELQRGQWTVTSDDGSPVRRICLGSPMQFVQLRHDSRATCSRLVVEDEPGKVTVHYTCRRNGYGRTTIRRETGTLMQIESQGIAGNRPFQFRAEARRTGACR